jgi:hypothetical protein
MKLFNKKPDEKIIQDYTNKYKQEIAEKLNSAMQVGSWKNDIPVEHITGGKTDQKGYNERSNMGFEGNKSKVKYLLM